MSHQHNHLMTLRFSAVDTWFFRDARPYNQGDVGQMNIATLFPPSTRTLVGATRAAMARRRGWDGLEPWSDTLKAAIGGSDVLAPLAFRGPLLMEGDTLLLPVPLNILGSTNDEGFAPRTRLEPGPKEVHCDLGCKIRLVTPTDPHHEGLKLIENSWVTHEGFNAILHGELPKPSTLRSPKQLYSTEARVGVQRKPSTHTVEEGMLYSTQHIRPKSNLALTMTVTGWSGASFEELVPLGGDGRQAFCQSSPSNWPLPSCPVPVGATTAAVYLVTPAHISPSALKPGPLNVPGLEGLDLVAACVNKPQRVGGWDVAKRRPVAVNTLLSPGAVLYVRGSRARVERLIGQHGQTIGERSDWGNGLILVGTWNDPHSSNPSA